MDIKKEIRNLLFRLGSEIVNEAKQNTAPYRTGNLKKDIQVIKVTDNEVEIGNTKKAFYAAFVHGGTKPHKIKAKNKKVLASKGKIFGKSVNHPGTKANPYLEIAMENYIKNGGMDRAVKSFSDKLSEMISIEIKKQIK